LNIYKSKQKYQNIFQIPEQNYSLPFMYECAHRNLEQVERNNCKMHYCKRAIPPSGTLTMWAPTAVLEPHTDTGDCLRLID
jgi:hypothetical protein